MDSLGPHQVSLDQWIALAPFEKLLNMEILSAEEGKAVLTMPFHYEYAQGAGVMHGGAITALADTALAMAVKSLVPAGTHFGTISLSVRFLKAVRSGVISTTAEIVKREDRDLDGVATVNNENGEAVLEVEARFRIARHQPMLEN